MVSCLTKTWNTVKSYLRILHPWPILLDQIQDPSAEGVDLQPPHKIFWFFFHFNIVSVRLNSKRSSVFLFDWSDSDVKSKIIVSRRHFLPTLFFLPLQKFKTIKTKLEKNSYTQTNARVYYIFQETLDIFSNIYALLFIFNKL